MDRSSTHSSVTLERSAASWRFPLDQTRCLQREAALARRLRESVVITIQGRSFANDRCLIIGEVAQAHDGSLGMAHAFIDAIAGAGADAVKFQTHIAAAESTAAESWRVKTGTQDESRYAYWKRMEFSEVHWLELKRHAESCGVIFLSSPFSIEAVELLERLEVTAWKIPSGEIGNPALLDRVTQSGRPVLLSSGMSPLSELDAAVAQVRSRGVSFAVMQCTSSYPCPPEQVGLNLLSVFRKRYECDVGLSDHSGTIFPGLAAVATGLSVLEVHVTLSRAMFGPDVTSSITTEELRLLTDGVRQIERMRTNPVNKDAMAETLGPMRSLFTKSIVARKSLPAGATILREHVTLKKPGTGLPASRLDHVIGRRLRRALSQDDILQDADLA